MGTCIVLILLLLLVVIGIKNSLKHFRGEGGCCGGGSAPKKVKAAKLSKVVSTKEITIAGMTCDHCRIRVQNALNSLEHVNAKVDLKQEKAFVSLEQIVEDDALRKVVEEQGYRVVEIIS